MMPLVSVGHPWTPAHRVSLGATPGVDSAVEVPCHDVAVGLDLLLGTDVVALGDFFHGQAWLV